MRGISMGKLKGTFFFRWSVVLFGLLGLIGLSIGLYVWALTGEGDPPEEAEKIEMRTDILVVIDPGHGGIDSGTHDGQGILEKDITLDIGLKMKEYLMRQGVPVIMTRETDEDVSNIDGRGRHLRDLQERVKIIDQGTVAFSIHVNYSTNTNENGFIVFYYRDSQKGQELGEKAHQALALTLHPNHTTPVPRSNLYLLRNSKVPIILVEVGFISNQHDKHKLQDPMHRQTIAQSLSEILIE